MSNIKPWMKPFVAQCVASITDPSYRRRLKEELADHLEALAADLERSGLTPDAARERALEEMGDPQKLREEYRQAWLKQSQSPRSLLRTMAAGWGWMAGGYLLAICLLALAGFQYDSGAYPIQGHPERLALYGRTLFLVSCSAGGTETGQRLSALPSQSGAGDGGTAGGLAGGKGRRNVAEQLDL